MDRKQCDYVTDRV